MSVVSEFPVFPSEGLLWVGDSDLDKGPSKVSGTLAANLHQVIVDVEFGDVAPTFLTLFGDDAPGDAALREVWSGSLRLPSRRLLIQTLDHVIAEVAGHSALHVRLLVDDPSSPMRVAVGASSGDASRPARWVVNSRASAGSGGSERGAVQAREDAIANAVRVSAPATSARPLPIACVHEFAWGLMSLTDADSTETLHGVGEEASQVWAGSDCLAVRVQHAVDGPVAVEVSEPGAAPPHGTCIHSGTLEVPSGGLRIEEADGAVIAEARVTPGRRDVRVWVDRVEHAQRVQIEIGEPVTEPSPAPREPQRAAPR